MSSPLPSRFSCSASSCALSAPVVAASRASCLSCLLCRMRTTTKRIAHVAVKAKLAGNPFLKDGPSVCLKMMFGSHALKLDVSFVPRQGSPVKQRRHCTNYKGTFLQTSLANLTRPSDKDWGNVESAVDHKGKDFELDRLGPHCEDTRWDQSPDDGKECWPEPTAKVIREVGVDEQSEDLEEVGARGVYVSFGYRVMFGF